MKDKILNEAEMRNKYLSPASAFSSKYITLPNIMVMRWVSFGYSFQNEFPLKTDEDYDVFVHWWLLNRYGTKLYEKEILDFFLRNYHSLDIDIQHDVIPVTPLMELIWRSRKDLQELFADIKNSDRPNYWRWWCQNGWVEYKLPTPVFFKTPDGVWPQGNLIKVFKELVWEWRKDLQDEFPDPMNNDRDRFTNWLIKHKEEHGFYYGITEGVFNSVDTQLTLQPTDLVKNNDVKAKVKNNKKIALIGHPTGMFGIGEDARLIARSLEAVGIEVDLYSANPGINVNKVSCEHTSNLSDYHGGYKANIFCLPVFDMLGIVLDYKLDVFTSTVNIGLWQWELSEFPHEADFAFELVHHVWSISQFASKSIEQAANSKVDVLPLPVLKPKYEKKSRRYFQLPDNDFIYFFSFDGGSFVNRKNPLGVIEAFQRAFPGKSGVCCVIKVINAAPNDIWHECQRRALCDKRIYIVDAALDRSDFLALMNVSDVVVSLHRSEGFGRIMAEALLLEKPVIASGYSGNMDYMTEENSFIVKGKLIPLFEQDYLFAQGKVWFEPDINHAADRMRYVLENQSESVAKAKKGKLEIQNRYSIQKSGEVLRDLLSNLDQGYEYD